MHQLLRAIAVACTSWILFSACSAAPPPPSRANVEHYRYTRRRPVSYNYDAYSFHPSSTFLGSVPSSRTDMAPNASPFQLAPYKNPQYLRSLINSVSTKLAQGAYASKRFDIPNMLTPPGSQFGGPGAPLYLPQNFGAHQQQHLGAFQQQQLPAGYGFAQQQALPFASGPGAPPQAPFQGNPLSADEFQHYLKVAAAPLPATTNTQPGGQFLSQDDFQKYLKISTKKNKGSGSSLTPEEFQKFVLAAQEARDSELLKNGKPKPDKLQTLTPDDFKKFFTSNKEKAVAGPGQFKKHKRGHSPSSGGYPSGPSSYSDYPAPPPPKYGPPPPQKHHSNPPPEAYPDYYPQHHIESEDEATKRSVLDALWRAFQAITGGALTIGGHLAKGSGAILQAKGKLIASAGPVVSEFGKTVAAKAAIPSYAPSYSHGTPYHHHSDHHVEEYHSVHPSLLQTAYDVASSFKVVALGTTKAVADLISQLSSASAKAYLLKE